MKLGQTVPVTGTAMPTSPPRDTPHPRFHRGHRPSCPVSTASDSRSSRRTGLPPCQQQPAPSPFSTRSLLVHSSAGRQAGESPPADTANTTLAGGGKRQQSNRPEGRSDSRVGGGLGGAEERAGHASAAELVSSVGLSVRPSSPLLPAVGGPAPLQTLPASLTLAFAMTSSFPVWPRPRSFAHALLPP